VSDEDVKGLLGRAFGQEPPLGIDRDAVLAQGRKRLRRRRLAEAGGVIAAVVVVAVGATTLTNLAGSDSTQLPPAASTTVYAPPGIDLPLAPTTETTKRATQLPTSTPESATALSAETAHELTRQLYKGDLLSAGKVEPFGGKSGEPAFLVRGTMYIYEADVYRSGRQGSLQIIIRVDPATPPPTSCAGGQCEDITIQDVTIKVGHYQGRDGEESYSGTTTGSDGISVSVSATNNTTVSRQEGKQPTGPPVLSKTELCQLVAQVDLSAR
jgi:hypothetical protein